MSNDIFAQYATSTAFAVQLSKNQCNMLLRIHACDIDFSKPSSERSIDTHYWRDDHVMATMQVGHMKSLVARGLIFWHTDANGKADGFGGLTKAGKLMCELLIEAGLTIENTNTVSVLKALQREAA